MKARNRTSLEDYLPKEPQYNFPMFGEDHQLKLIKEGLIETYPIDTTVCYLRKQLGFVRDFKKYISIVDGEQGLKNIQVTLLNEWRDLNYIKETAIKYLNACGYTLSQTFYEEDRVVMEFESKYTDDISKYLQCGKYLFHISPIKYKDKILNIGLIPKSKNAKYGFPYRIYLAYSQPRAMSLAPDLESVSRYAGGFPNNSYCLFRIDISKLPRNIKFYRDSKYQGGCWTYDNIPPEAIKLIMVVDFFEDE